MDFENEEDYLKYTDKITDAFYDQDLEKLSKLLQHKVTSQSQAEYYFNDIWKKEVRIKAPKNKLKVREKIKKE